MPSLHDVLQATVYDIAREMNSLLTTVEGDIRVKKNHGASKSLMQKHSLQMAKSSRKIDTKRFATVYMRVCHTLIGVQVERSIKKRCTQHPICSELEASTRQKSCLVAAHSLLYSPFHC